MKKSFPTVLSSYQRWWIVVLTAILLWNDGAGFFVSAKGRGGGGSGVGTGGSARGGGTSAGSSARGSSTSRIGSNSGINLPSSSTATTLGAAATAGAGVTAANAFSHRRNRFPNGAPRDGNFTDDAFFNDGNFTNDDQPGDAGEPAGDAAATGNSAESSTSGGGSGVLVTVVVVVVVVVLGVGAGCAFGICGCGGEKSKQSADNDKNNADTVDKVTGPPKSFFHGQPAHRRTPQFTTALQAAKDAVEAACRQGSDGRDLEQATPPSPVDGTYQLTYQESGRLMTSTNSFIFRSALAHAAGWEMFGRGTDPDGPFVILEGLVAPTGQAFWVEQAAGGQVFSTGRFVLQSQPVAVPFTGGTWMADNGVRGPYTYATRLPVAAAVSDSNTNSTTGSNSSGGEEPTISLYENPRA